MITQAASLVFAATALADPGVPGLAGRTGGISWGFVGAALIVWALTTALTWLIAAKITSAVLREQNKNLRGIIDELKADVAKISSTIGKLYADINTLRTDRAGCELRATKRFATQIQFTQTLVEVSANHREVLERLDAMSDSFRESVAKVHSRVDELQERTTRTEERVGTSHE